MTDAYGANVRAEASISKERGVECSSLQQLCERLAPLCTKLTSCVWDIRESLERGKKLPLDRTLVLQLSNTDMMCYRFCTTGVALLVWLVILEMIPNGDWTREDCVEWCANGTTDVPNKSVLVEMMASSLILAMAGQWPTLWPQHRWTWADVAVEQLGLFGLTAFWILHTRGVAWP
eukprot:97821-Amphidinium_carterae.2